MEDTPWLAVAQLVIMCGVLILPGIGIRAITRQHNLLDFEINYYGDAYTLSTWGGLEDGDGILKEDMESNRLALMESPAIRHTSIRGIRITLR